MKKSVLIAIIIIAIIVVLGIIKLCTKSGIHYNKLLILSYY